MKGFVELSDTRAALIYGGRDERIAEIVREIGRFIGRLIRMIEKMREAQKEKKQSAVYG